MKAFVEDKEQKYSQREKQFQLKDARSKKIIEQLRQQMTQGVTVDQGSQQEMQLGEYLGKGMTFKEAKRMKMPNETVEGADLALEIGLKIKKDFDKNSLPLMISMVENICDEMPLKVEWKNFKKDQKIF